MFKVKSHNSKRKINNLSQKKIYSNSISQKTFFHQRNIPRNNNLKNKVNRIKIISIQEKISGKKVDNFLREYYIFKSNLYSKEKEEKENQENNIIQNSVIKHLERNMNYSNIIRLLDLGLNMNNPFKSNDVKNKINELENINKNIKKNKIDINLLKKVLHNSKIKSKVDSDIKRDHNFDKIYRKIKNYKLQYEKKIRQRTKFSNTNNYYTIKEYRNNKRRKITNNSSTKMSSYNYTNSENKDNANINNIDNLKKKIIRSKSARRLNDITFHINDNSKISSKDNKSFRNMKLMFKDKFFSKNTSVDENKNYNNAFRPSSQFKSRFNKLRKFNNSQSKFAIFESKDNSNRSIINSKNLKSNYASIIEDIYKDFRKIKSNSIKLKSKYKEWGFSSYKKIDEVVKTREDMLLFHLKQKYLKNVNLFQKDKKRKYMSKNESVIHKIMEDIDLYDEQKKT